MGELVDGQYQKYFVESGAYFRAELLRHRSAAAEDGGALERRAARQDAAAAATIRTRFMRLTRRRSSTRVAHRDSGQDDQGLRTGRERRGPQHHPPAEEDQRRRADRPSARASEFRSRTKSCTMRRSTVRPTTAPKFTTCASARKAAGRIPAGAQDARAQAGAARDEVFEEFYSGTEGRKVSTTMVFVRMLAKLLRDPEDRQADRADHPGRGAHLRHGGAVPAGRNLLQRGPALRAGRHGHAALLQGSQGRPDPGGGHHRSGHHVLVHRRRHSPTPTTAST